MNSLTDYEMETLPTRRGHANFIGDGQFRHNWLTGTRAEQRKDYETASHYYGEAVKFAKDENKKAIAQQRKTLCDKRIEAAKRQPEWERIAETTKQVLSRQHKDSTSELKQLLNR